MPTPNTPLPELVTQKTFQITGTRGEKFLVMSPEANTINQIITYLKEREVSENESYAQGYAQGAYEGRRIGREEAQPGEHRCVLGDACPYHQTEKPGLKETLLGEIDKAQEGKSWSEFERGFDEGLETAKAIINRVFKDNAN